MTAVADVTGLDEDHPDLAAVYALVNAQLAELPDAPDDRGAALYMEILNARHWSDLDAPYSGKSMTRWNGQQLVIDALHKLPSTIGSRLSWYVVAHGALRETGDEVTFITSSWAVVCQLLCAYRNGWLPLVCVPRVAARKTTRGFYAHHLDVIGVLDGNTAGSA